MQILIVTRNMLLTVGYCTIRNLYGFIIFKTGSLTVTKKIDDLLGKGNKEEVVFNLSIDMPWRLHLRNGKILSNI
jgi:hypothetical protein